MLKVVVSNQISFQYVLNDLWFSSAENMCYVKLDLKKDFIVALKHNRKVALSQADKQQSRYQRLDQLRFIENAPMTVYIEQVPFALLLVRQDFTNEDGSSGMRYLVSSDLNLGYDQILAIYQKRWKVEKYQRSLKQNAALAKSPTRTETTQTNHVAAALLAFVKLEMWKVHTKKNHYELKARLYFSALQHAFHELRRLKSGCLIEPFTA
jgi:transposase